jgi:carboxymethylenebutenolidase
LRRTKPKPLEVASEHVYWDQGSVLAQLGILDPAKVPVKGAETARTLLNWAGIETSPSGLIPGVGA